MYSHLLLNSFFKILIIYGILFVHFLILYNCMAPCSGLKQSSKKTPVQQIVVPWLILSKRVLCIFCQSRGFTRPRRPYSHTASKRGTEKNLNEIVKITVTGWKVKFIVCRSLAIVGNSSCIFLPCLRDLIGQEKKCTFVNSPNPTLWL